MAAIVIADASPLIALARVGGLSWLQQLFTEVMVTDVVLAEVLTGRYPDTEAPIGRPRLVGCRPSPLPPLNQLCPISMKGKPPASVWR